MGSKRQEFTDRQKADIFARDRALCCFTGKSLWLLDYGGGPSTVDWVDHINPAARGGRADIDNGACASWLYNKQKRDCNQGIYLFFEGRPTETFYTYYETLPQSIAQHLIRFQKIHFTDWYFNRAIFHIQLATAQIVERKRADGKTWTRGLEYRNKAAFKFLCQWRNLVVSEKPSTMTKRHLLPSRPSSDQQIVLKLLDAQKPDDIGKIAKALAPFSKASWNALSSLAYIESRKEALDFAKTVMSDPCVTVRVKKAVESNIYRIWNHTHKD
jgi:hypothetical protein